MINMALTKKVIALHDKGYDFDFFVTEDHRVLCVQDNRSFTIDQLTIEMVDMHFDKFTGGYKYIHTVETYCEDKGLIVDCSICVNSMLEGKFRLRANHSYAAI
ncbi:hypothetical protein HDF24_18535 [Mucilaginibacter sp. X4EP1]|uniref:hypothetical protein n=1 Tax=Mucilaginibacter sp. X4EP1 TaxID=2723092 RepID=UPI00216A0531|nr:hypothetical protein [Mucilaginibacter sp. X4EP1]MCS3813430.1 hypothetical protein [Mucilaginibacter sp. X4EP1]